MTTKKDQLHHRRHHQLHHQQKMAFQITGFAVGAVLASNIFMRIIRFLRRGNSSDFKFIINLDAAKILKLAEELISRSQKVHDAVASVPLEKVTYDNVIAPLASLEAEEFALIQSCKFPRLVSSSKEVQQASKDAESMLDAYKVKCSARVDVYRVVKAFSQKNSNLQPEADRYVCYLVRDFERQGLNLRPELRDEAERLKTRIRELCNVFQNNLNEDETALQFTTEELAGMHPNFIKGLNAGDGCKLTVTLKPCHYLPIMEHCKVRATRSAVATSRYRRCMKENIPILEKVLDLRRKFAMLLGYRNWAEYCLEVRMTRNPEKVKEFHDQMLRYILPRANQELKLLQDLKEEEEGDQTFGVEDILYYIRKAERRLLNFNMNNLDQYFPFEVVTTGLLKIYGHLLGLQFLELEKKNVWHEEVQEFSVVDLQSREVMGFFYLDAFSRDGKYSHPCVVPLQPSCDLANGKRQLPVAALLMNLTKSGSDTPTLLKHSELVLYFHEFGHLMHHICSRASFARFSGLLVETDFLETPSHMLENWCYERDSLKLMSCSYKDPDAGIPDSMLKVLKEKRRSFLALRTLRNHLFIGILDQIIHTEDKVSIEQVIKDLFPEVVLGIPNIEGTNIAASTLHFISGGCDAVCYSYLWSEVFAADMFEARFKGNMMNNIAGLEYRNKVLAPGATKDARQILREFLGRDPSLDAYVRLNGLNEVDEF